MTWKRNWSVSIDDISQSWFLCLHADMFVHINQELVTRIRYGGKVFHTGEHLNGISLGKGNFAKKKGWWAPFWNPTQVESCAPPSSRAACSHLCHELAWDIDCYVLTIGFTSVIIRVSPDGTVIILAVKKDEADHEHVDGEVGEDVALVAVHQVQQLAPGLVRARQVLQHRLACHPFNIQVPLLWKHL